MKGSLGGAKMNFIGYKFSAKAFVHINVCRVFIALISRVANFRVFSIHSKVLYILRLAKEDAC